MRRRVRIGVLAAVLGGSLFMMGGSCGMGNHEGLSGLGSRSGGYLTDSSGRYMDWFFDLFTPYRYGWD